MPKLSQRLLRSMRNRKGSSQASYLPMFPFSTNTDTKSPVDCHSQSAVVDGHHASSFDCSSDGGGHSG